MNSVSRRSRVLTLLTLLITTLLVFGACTDTANDGVIVEEPVVVDEPIVVDEPVVEEDIVVEEELVIEEEPVVVGDTALVDEAAVAAVQDVMISANRLLDFDLENAFEDDLGDIQNLLVDINTGNIPYVIVESNGFLGFSNEDVIFPMNAFELGADGGELILPFAQPEDIEGAPVVNEETWAIDDGTWDDNFFDFWSTSDYGSNLVNFENSASTVLLSDLIGYGTAAWGDLGVGFVNGVLVDLGTDSAKWVVVDYADSGIANYTDNVVLIPFTAFDWLNMGTELGFMPDLDPEALNGAPLVNRDELFAADFLGADFDSEIVSYWQGMGYEVD